MDEMYNKYRAAEEGCALFPSRFLQRGTEMSQKFYAKSPGNEGYIKNREVLSDHDCDNHCSIRRRTGNTIFTVDASSDTVLRSWT